MISDDERREVAKRLRVYSHDFDLSDSDPFRYVSKAVFGDVLHTYCSVFARLADLIDRPTCRKLIPDEMEGLVFCSNCGAEIGEYGVPNYCHNCGAKVVE